MRGGADNFYYVVLSVVHYILWYVVIGIPFGREGGRG